nr:flagellin [Alteribacter salitolerans]
MRAGALGISGVSDAAANGVGGKDAGAVFTDAHDVSNGTDNAKSESALDVSTHENASAAVEVLNQAIESVSAQRSELGAFQNRLEHTISNLNNASENLSAAESRIRDVDMAAEMMEMTRTNILSQASQSMLAQANQQPQSVLQLLG